MGGDRWRGSVRLAQVVIGRLVLIELGLEVFGRGLTESLLDELAGLPAFIASKSPGLDPGLPLGIDGDLDGLVQAPPPTVTVNFTDPSGRACSTTAWPLRRASNRVFSTA